MTSPDDTEQAVRINGAVQLAAGTLLALGWAPRLSATAIAVSLVPTTVAGHGCWAEADRTSGLASGFTCSRTWR